jgi:hypothetical protein
MSRLAPSPTASLFNILNSPFSAPPPTAPFLFKTIFTAKERKDRKEETT